MAGSFHHVVSQEDGKLLENGQTYIENLGDAYETIEEMYGMIWYLAAQLATSDPANGNVDDASLEIERARLRYKEGLKYSPGTDGQREEDDE